MVNARLTSLAGAGHAPRDGRGCARDRTLRGAGNGVGTGACPMGSSFHPPRRPA
ncbi:hypothetical protein A33M_3585 [Rhodovulum sp. PH10]|nr:hypothetical protein A33M_3585 [Rhodovulum sp. PH10]